MRMLFVLKTFIHTDLVQDQRLPYSRERLLELVETLIEASEDDRFIQKVLADHGWNESKRG